jgi:negative regulator of flagellin synthesis FlgM
MKIENTGLQPLSAKPTKNANPIERREELNETESVRGGQDKVEMSENARLLAKARAALGNTESADSERIAQLKQQVESGDYTVQVGDLARKLIAKLFPK